MTLFEKIFGKKKFEEDKTEKKNKKKIPACCGGSE